MIKYAKQTTKWDVWEASVEGPKDGNPFVEQFLRGTFYGGWAEESVTAEGFYDGDGIYKIRFMPSSEGEYSFCLTASFLEEEIRGTFFVKKAREGNHGPVRVVNTYHFAYEDKTPYYPVGTTCYVWHLQTDELIRETLKQLKEAGFNKIRFCILPKHYHYNLREPRSYPYEGTPVDSSSLTEENAEKFTGHMEGNHWDFTRFRPEYFRHIESCLEALEKLGIEADLIAMHPYDRWGFSCMTKEQDDLYWNYIIARFSAYHHVWWALANEYDFMKSKTTEDWERYGSILCHKDPYGHLRSIHNAGPFYDHSRPWITHCSIQKQEVYKTAEYTNSWRNRYQKPVVLDEVSYEGNLCWSWGNIDGEEMIRRFWEAVCRGGYCGHGETFVNPQNILWWSHGGRLHGESWKRIRFLRNILNETPGYGLEPSAGDSHTFVISAKDKEQGTRDYMLFYHSFLQPAWQKFHFDDVTPYRVEIIDTWNMTIQDIGIRIGEFKVELPGRRYMAIRLRKADSE